MIGEFDIASLHNNDQQNTINYMCKFSVHAIGCRSRAKSYSVSALFLLPEQKAPKCSGKCCCLLVSPNERTYIVQFAFPFSTQEDKLLMYLELVLNWEGAI